MKILITGFPGMGKTAIAAELKRRGHAAYDPEAMRGYMHLQNVETGQHIHKPVNPPRGWFDNVGAYNWDIPRVSSLLDAHEEVFICSLADNMDALWSRFDKVFVLTLDDLLLEQRIRERTTKGPGDDTTQLADVMMLHRHFENSLIAKGAFKLDVRPGVHELVDRILSISYGH